MDADTSIELGQLSFASSDGLHRCHLQEWNPDGPARAVVQIVHGMADHIGRYDEFARFLNNAGFAVLGEDHLGHGLTACPGELGFFAEHDGRNTVMRDVRAARLLAAQRPPGGRHGMLAEINRGEVYEDLLRWLERVSPRQNALPKPPGVGPSTV